MAYLRQITKQTEKNAMVSRNKNSDKITESRNAKS